MINEESIQKALTKLTSDEKGWRKALASAEGSFSREQAEENLSRLAVLRQTLNTQLQTNELRRQQVMRNAVIDGIVTDHSGDGVLQQLLKEGWLERAEVLPPRPHVSRSPAYLPTEKAMQEWQMDANGLARLARDEE